MKLKVKRGARKKKGQMWLTALFTPRFITRRELRVLARQIREYSNEVIQRPIGQGVSSIQVLTCQGSLVLRMLFRQHCLHQGDYRKGRQAALEIASRIQVVVQAFDRLCAVQKTPPSRK